MAENNQANAPAQEQDLSEILKVRREKLAALRAEGRDPFQQTRFDVSHHAQDIKDHFDELEGTEVTVGGRLMSKRGMGKVSFCDLQDKSGRIQIYARKDEMDEEEYNRFKKYDIGDIVGVRGEVFRTQRGEMSVRAKEITLLSKSLRPLPEKFHGLRDTDTRYRRRYLDLIVNPDVKDTFIKRSLIIREIRNYLDSNDFIEVETPILVQNAGGAAARPFVTHHNALNEDLNLRISLELYLKRLIVGGLERVYEMGRVFRNEGLDVRHNPEFTLLEIYQAYTDFHGMMDLVEELYRTVALKVLGTAVVTYDGVEIDLSKPFARMTMVEAVKKYAGVDFAEIDLETARSLAKEHGIEFEERHKKGDLLNLFFEGRVGCFSPVTHLSRTGIKLIRPMLYLPEKDIRYFAAKANLPVIKSPCPADGNTEREEMKRLLGDLERKHRGLRHRIFGAMQRGNISGFGLSAEPVSPEEESDESQ